MIRSRDFDDAPRITDERAQVGRWAERVLLADDEERWNLRPPDARCGVRGNGKPDSDERDDPRISVDRAKCRRGSEGKPAGEKREADPALGLIERRPNVVRLSPPGVVRSLGETDAAKVEPKGSPSRLHEGLRRSEDDLVVERAPEKRMRMGESRAAPARRRRVFPESLETSGGARKGDRLQSRGHGAISARWRNCPFVIFFPPRARGPAAEGQESNRMHKIVHVVGTGTIGEPLIGLFADFKKYLGIDEITFHKRTPMTTERAKVNHLLLRGAKLAVDADKVADFEALGHKVDHEATEALERATVVIDCTPAGNENKKVYEKLSGPRGFLAQGSEFGFGKPYAMGINDEALVAGDDRFIQIVSCNTHNIAALVKTLSEQDDHRSGLEKGRFVCLRRANDVSQDSSFSPAPAAGKHDDPQFGTHHARDASRLLETIGWKTRLFSSAMKLNTQYMHSLWFDLELTHPMTKERALERLRANHRIAITEKRSSNQIFSFGRDHGYYGRILSQAVVAAPTLTVSGDRELVGFCFTPQDGNSLASSIAAALWLMEPGYDRQERMGVLDRFFFREI